ncbi:protein kinase [Dionaea muscipula]
MAVLSVSPSHHRSSAADDPLLPWLRSIKDALDELYADPNRDSMVLEELVKDCIKTFKKNPRYQNDVRFLKVWFLYMDCSGDFESVYGEMEECKICLKNAVLYETGALFLEAKGKLVDAHRVYEIGISMNAEPIERLKKAHSLFLERMSLIVDACSAGKGENDEPKKLGNSFVNPWSASVLNDLLQKINPQILSYEGYYSSSKKYPGRAGVSSLRNLPRNTIIEIGNGRKYQIKGCAGQGGFAQVFKANILSNPDEVVALKIQTPPFPWEFYMYRQLDQRIPEKERSNFGFAQRMNQYSDYSILVCDYLSHGTLQDAINSYLVVGGVMEEALCIFYTIEMLHILDTLHAVDIIHGDFKPDNLLIRYAREDLNTEKDDFLERSGSWHDQGLCLVDWGRGIDLNLFPDNTMFKGDCRTSSFRCIEMQEDKPWKYQVDTYGLCVVAHLMLHGSYMEVEKKASSDGNLVYFPKSSFKRYWNGDLWKSLFEKLLNIDPNDDHKKILRDLKVSFQEYISSNPPMMKKLKQLLVKQRASLCSA